MSILFATPMYGGVCTKPYFESCLRLKEELTRQEFRHDFLTGTNESLVTRARNEMAASFLETDYSHLFFIDADIEFSPEDVSRLWNLQADVAVGLYCMKRLDKPLSAWRGGKMVKLDECPAEPFEVDYAGTGFFLISRHVLETLAAQSESYEGPDGRVSALFMTPVHNDIFESEDYFFCRRAREAGFKIIADPAIKLGHYGQFRYGG